MRCLQVLVGSLLVFGCSPNAHDSAPSTSSRVAEAAQQLRLAQSQYDEAKYWDCKATALDLVERYPDLPEAATAQSLLERARERCAEIDAEGARRKAEADAQAERSRRLAEAKRRAESGGISLLSLIGRSVSGVASQLGSSTKTVPITSDPSQMPGEFRDYRASSADVLVRFHRGKAVDITFWFDSGSTTPEALMRRVGVDVDDLTVVREGQSTTQLTARVWRVQAGGRPVEISAMRGLGVSYDMVQAKGR